MTRGSRLAYSSLIVTPRKQIKRRIRVWLAAQGKTQNWLAKELDVPRSQLSMVLSGARNPGLRMALALEAKTGVVRAEEFVS